MTRSDAAPSAPEPSEYVPIPGIIPRPKSIGERVTDYVPKPIERGMRQGIASAAATSAGYLGLNPEQAADLIARQQANIQANPQPPKVRRFFEEGTFESFVDAPLEITGTIVAESLGQFAPILGLSALTASAGPAGPIATVGTGSFALEAGGKILDVFAESGVDLTKADQVRTAFENPDLMAEARKKAALKGVPVALFDAVSMGIAGRLFSPVRKVAGRLAGAGAEITAQAGLGAAGETAGQLAAGEELDPAAIAAEAIGEIGTGPVEIVTAYTSRQGRPAKPRPSPAQAPTVPQEPAPAPRAPEAPPSRTGESPTGRSVITPRGRRVDVDFEVIDAGSLVTSDMPTFPGELQPRDRTRAASGEQIARIAANLEPELLGDSPTATDGAPIIGPDGIVESGNARVMAIRQAYSRGLPSAQRYREFLKGQGYKVEGMVAPVLVRRRATELSSEDRIAFTREANERTTADMSISEQAGTDAKAIPDELLDLYRGGSLTAAANRDFIRTFVETVVSENDRAAVYTREGGLSQEGARRIEGALFARAYDDAEMLGALREDTDANFKAIGEGMVDASPAWAQMRRDAAAGTISPELDITPALQEAVALVRRARRDRTPISDYVRQGDLVSGGTSPEAVAILRLAFRDDGFKRPASRDRFAGSLRFYAQEARKAKGGPGLFPGAPKVGVLDILKLARQRSEGGLLDIMGDAAEMRTGEPRPSANDNAVELADEKLREEIRDFIESDPATKAFNEALADAAADAAIFARNWNIGGEGNVREVLNEDFNHVAEITPLKGGGYRLSVLGTPIAERFNSYAEAVDWVLGRDPKPQGSGQTLSLEQVEARVQTSAPGVAYTGFVPDAVDAGTAAPPKLLRREDILRPLMKALGVPLYQGRMKQRNVLGFYRRRLEEVRIKKMSDIEVAAHEIAHLLDDRIPEIRKQWLPATNANKTIREELRGVSYDASKIFEGFAEFVRLWATQTEQARAKAPNFFAWWEDFVARSEYGPALRKAQQDMTAWFSQDAIQRARSKIGVAKEINAALVKPLDNFRQTVADDLHGIMKMEKDLTGKTSPVGAYETARLTRSKQAFIEGTLLYGAPVVKPDGSHAFEGKGLHQILDPVADKIEDFLMYAVGRSASELKSQNREHLFTPAEITGMIRLETPEFRTAFEQYQEWNRAILDFAEAKGLINPAARARWKRTQYLPFHRVGQPGAFSPVPGDWRGLKALTGGTGNLRDVLGSIIGNASMLIDAALTNEARVKTANLAALRGGARFMAKIPTEERNIKIHRAEVERRILEALGVKHKNQLTPDVAAVVGQIIQGMDGWVWLAMKGQAPLGGNVVAVLHQGVPAYYEVADPLLYRSLMSLNRPTREGVVRFLSWARRVGQMSITLSLDFVAANFARDTLMASVMSRHGFKPFIDSARGLASRLTTDQNYKDFIANGGGFSSYLLDEEAFRTHLEHFYSRRGIDYRTVLDTPAKLLLGLERIADAFEMSARLGEFRRATEQGKHPRHAAYEAREVSTDFAMRGDSAALGFMYDSILFLKAGVNGVDRFYRGIARDPNRMHVAAKAAIIGILSMGLYALNRGNPLYDEMEDWLKDTHWHFFVPKPETYDAWSRGEEVPASEAYWHFSYPKAWEIGAIGSISERALEGFLDAQPGKAATDSLRIIRELFRFEYLPHAVAPPIEQGLNRIRFLDRPIESQAMQSLAPWARTGPYTSEALKRLGEATRNLPEAFQVNPVKLEALLRGYLNTWAMYGLTLADAAVEDDKPDMRVDQYPAVRRFFREQPAKSTRHLTELYDAIDAATQARRTMRHLDQTLRPDLAGEIEHKPENLEYGQLERADVHLRSIRKEIAQAIEVRSLEEVRDLVELRSRLPDKRLLAERARAQGKWDQVGTLKRFLIDDLVAERNAYAKRVMKDVRERRKELESIN